jgi:hypothetical protein
MSCVGSIAKLLLIGLVLAALFVAGIFVVAIFDVMTGGDDVSATQELRTDGSESQVAVASAPIPTPPPPPPSLEQRIESAQEALRNLKLGAQEALNAAVSSTEPDAALREVTLSLETVADGANGANSVAKQLSEEMSEIQNKMQSIRTNTYLSKADKNELLKTLTAQQVSVQKTLGQARKFCDELRSIQTKDIPSWTSTYSHFVTVLGSSEALKKIAPRIKAAAGRLGPSQ